MNELREHMWALQTSLFICSALVLMRDSGVSLVELKAPRSTRFSAEPPF